MPVAKIPIIKGDKISLDADYRDALPVNMYAINKPILGNSGYMVQHSGLVSFGSAIPGDDRGGVWNERLGIHFRVIGNTLYSVSESGSVTDLGTIVGSQKVQFAYSFNTQAIVADGVFYLYDQTNGLRQVQDEDTGAPIDIAWIDSYYFMTDGEFLFHTNVANEEEIDPLDFATAEFSPDATLGVERNYDNTVMAFGRYTIEYFTNDATDDFAFRRIQSRAKTIGIIGTNCKASLDNQWIILGGRKEEQPTVYLISTSQNTNIATREIELLLAEYTEDELAKAVIETREEDGIQFAMLRLSRHTLLYNHTIAKALGTSQAWSLLRKEILTGGVWAGSNGVYDPRISKWVYGVNNGLATLTSSSSALLGEPIESILFSPFLKIESSSIDNIELETISGIPGKDTIVFVSLTYDGVTYGKEWALNISSTNNRSIRFILNRLGYVVDYVGFKFRIVSKNKAILAGFKITYD